MASPAAGPTYERERLDHLGIVARVCREIGLAEWLGAQDEHTHERVSVLEQIKQYDTELARLFLHHPDSVIFGSLPRAGKRLALRLLAGWGDDRERYVSAASVQALAGTSPVAYQSGNYAKAHRRYACVKDFCNVLYQFAWQSTFREPWAQAYYQRKRSEGKSHSMAVRVG